MYTGKRFRLKTDLLGIEDTPDRRIAVPVPAGEFITVLSGPRLDDRRLVDVAWSERKLAMFVEDLDRHGEEVRQRGTA